MKLSKKLTLNFMLLIIISIVIISITSNMMINNRFELFLINERENKFQEIYHVINELYIKDNFILDPMELKHYALSEDVNIVIKNIQGHVIYDSNTTNNLNTYKEIDGYGSINNNLDTTPDMTNKIPGGYVERAYNLSNNKIPIGTLILGYVDNAYLTDSAIIFKKTLWRSFVVSSLITAVFGLVISIILSKRLTIPLVTIKNTANQIQEGKLSIKSTVNTDVEEIIELSDSINFLAGSLSKQDNIRKRYASDVSHELRTPLTTLKSHIEAMIDGVWPADKEHLNILMSQITRLNNLVDNLKDSFTAEEYNAVIEKGKLNISLELENILKTFSPIYNKKGYSIVKSIEKNIEILMDKEKFNQIINNLLINSFNYLENGGSVFVELKVLEDRVSIIVKDNGIGIKEKYLPFIFDRFYRADPSRNTHTGGSGLGLSIVKSMVEAYDGKINISSKYKEGTHVSILFPIYRKSL